MALSDRLIDKFVKVTNDQKEDKRETSINGTYKVIDGKEYVQLDGSDILTPVTSTVEAETNERVKVLIKNHRAQVISNITSPTARFKTVQNLKAEVDEHGNTIQQIDNSIIQQGNSIIQLENNINQQGDTINSIQNTVDAQGNVISAHENTITAHGNSITSLNNDIVEKGNQIESLGNTVTAHTNTITAHGNNITSMDNTINQHSNTINQHGDTITSQGNTIAVQGNIIEAQGNTINQHGDTITSHGNTIVQHTNTIEQINSNITTVNSNISILNSGFTIVDGVLTGLNTVVVDNLKSEHLNTTYATIDFANINMAAVTKVFADSGIIKDLIVDQGVITGELVGVTIKGDLIEANTVKADKLVVQGEDGLYYKLNLDSLGEATVSHDPQYQSGLDGSVIIAKSITAEKVSVGDLVAFGATIGGFTITDDAIYSDVKSGVHNSTPGIYMDNTGQFSIGDNHSYVKYFYDEDIGGYKLDISGSNITIGATNQNLEELAQDVQENQQDQARKNAEFELNYNNLKLRFENTNGNNLLRNSVLKNGFHFWHSGPKIVWSTQPHPPQNPSEGQLWYNTHSNTMFIYTNGEWVKSEYSVRLQSDYLIDRVSIKEDNESRLQTLSNSIVRLDAGTMGNKLDGTDEFNHIFMMTTPMVIEQNQTHINLSFKVKNNMISGDAYFIVGFLGKPFEDTEITESLSDTSKEYWIKFDPDTANTWTQFEYTFKIPTKDDVQNGHIGATAPTDTTLAWLDTTTYDYDPAWPRRRKYDEETETWVLDDNTHSININNEIYTHRAFYGGYYKTNILYDDYGAQYMAILNTIYPSADVVYEESGTLPTSAAKGTYVALENSVDPQNIPDIVYRAQYNENLEFTGWYPTGMPTLVLRQVEYLGLIPKPPFPSKRAVFISGYFHWSDLKLTYGQFYTPWEGHNSEVYGRSYKMDDRGFQIYNGNNKMFIDEDEIVATFNNYEIFKITEDLTYLKYLLADKATVAKITQTQTKINDTWATIWYLDNVEV